MMPVNPMATPSRGLVAYLRLMGDDLKCCRCGSLYRSVRPMTGYRIGESPVHCPRCQQELTAPVESPWPDTFTGFVAGAALLLSACAAWMMVLR